MYSKLQEKVGIANKTWHTIICVWYLTLNLCSLIFSNSSLNTFDLLSSYFYVADALVAWESTGLLPDGFTEWSQVPVFWERIHIHLLFASIVTFRSPSYSLPSPVFMKGKLCSLFNCPSRWTSYMFPITVVAFVHTYSRSLLNPFNR